MGQVLYSGVFAIKTMSCNSMMETSTPSHVDFEEQNHFATSITQSLSWSNQASPLSDTHVPDFESICSVPGLGSNGPINSALPWSAHDTTHNNSKYATPPINHEGTSQALNFIPGLATYQTSLRLHAHHTSSYRRVSIRLPTRVSLV